MRVVMSGASGMLGRAIGDGLRQHGAAVTTLVRHTAQTANELQWNPSVPGAGLRAPGELNELEGIDAAVHLSGATVAGRRWTARYKQEIWKSRVDSTRALAEALARLKRKPEVLITASAVGYYGNRGDEILDEHSEPGAGFFPKLCAAWEEASRPATEAGIRVVHLRFGVVIGRKGGALDPMLPLFRLGLGGRLGSGRQWMSWVSEADVAGAALFILKGGQNAESGSEACEFEPVTGPVNVVAPEAVTNAEFTRELARALHRPAIIPAPAFALRLAFGEMADEALLASQRVRPAELLRAGYAFRHPTLREALAAALEK